MRHRRLVSISLRFSSFLWAPCHRSGRCKRFFAQPGASEHTPGRVQTWKRIDIRTDACLRNGIESSQDYPLENITTYQTSRLLRLQHKGSTCSQQISIDKHKPRNTRNITSQSPARVACISPKNVGRTSTQADRWETKVQHALTKNKYGPSSLTLGVNNMSSFVQ